MPSVSRAVSIALLVTNASRKAIAAPRSSAPENRILPVAFALNHNSRLNLSESHTSYIHNKSSALKMVTMDSPSAQRNKDPIWDVIESGVLPMINSNSNAGNQDSGSSSVSTHLNVLEIAAGCGVHSTYFTTKMAEKGINLSWYPTDPDPPSLLSLKERARDFVLPDGMASSAKIAIAEPISVSLGEEGILEEDSKVFFANKAMDLMICINMIHISPWTATIGLFKLASEQLKNGGVLLTYGPYKQNGTAVQSNLNFDMNLKARNSAWGVRDLEEVQRVAQENGLTHSRTIEMPANNLCLVFTKE